MKMGEQSLRRSRPIKVCLDVHEEDDDGDDDDDNDERSC
jgi:hypothetical protein